MRRVGALPELLAPAGDMECLFAAVAAGADAVYVGGRTFGARAYAKNFDIDELRLATEYCHLHWDVFGRNDAEAETPVLWPPHAKS